MNEPFIPTPENCTINGGKFRDYLAWDQLDWGRAQWCVKASLMIAVVGREAAPDDPHWSVPHKDGDTWFVWDRTDPRGPSHQRAHPDFRWMDREDARQGSLL